MKKVPKKTTAKAKRAPAVKSSPNALNFELPRWVTNFDRNLWATFFVGLFQILYALFISFPEALPQWARIGYVGLPWALPLFFGLTVGAIYVYLHKVSFGVARIPDTARAASLLFFMVAGLLGTAGALVLVLSAYRVYEIPTWGHVVWALGVWFVWIGPWSWAIVKCREKKLPWERKLAWLLTTHSASLLGQMLMGKLAQYL